MQKEKKLTEEEKAILAAFDEATEHSSEETTEEAHKLVKFLFGEEIPREAPITMLMAGFIMGIEEGMKLEASKKGRA